MSLALSLFLGLPTYGSEAEEPVLNIYNWADYIHPQIITDFEAEYGIKINYDNYASNEIVDTKLLTGHSGYDVVLHTASASARLVPIGVYLSLDYNRLENWHNIDQGVLERMKKNYPSKLVGVPYMWGTTGFTYNVDLIRQRMADAPVNSAALVFDADIVSRFADCGVSFLDDPISVIPMAMLYLGHPADSIEPAHLHEVEKLLKSIRPYIKYFSSTKLLLDLPSEEVCIAMSWSGDYSVANARAEDAGLDINLAYNIPSEGSVQWIDVWYVPADAPHPDNAYLWLDYMLRPEVIASATNFTGYANANSAATVLVDPKITADVAIYPDRETMKRLHSVAVLEPKLERRRSRTWTKIKTGL